MPPKLKGSKGKGRLLILRRSTYWDLIGGKEVPKQPAVYAILMRIYGGPTHMGACRGSRCGQWFRGHALPTASSSTWKGSKREEAAGR